MKHSLKLFIALAGIMPASALPLTTTAQTRIMVVSDPHVLSSTMQSSVADNTGKLDKYSYDILDKAIDNVILAKPDLLLVCGDLTYNGESSGHTSIRFQLSTVKDAGIPVLVIPGNHDILNPNSIDEGHANITAAQFATTYADMGYNTTANGISTVSRDANSLSWAASVNDKLAVIGLDANIYGGSAYYSDGCLRQSTLEWMKTQAAAFQSAGKMVIAMVHQQLIDRYTGSMATFKAWKPDAVLNDRYQQNPNELGDRVAYVNRNQSNDVSNADVLKAFADAGIHYVLTGHVHINHTATTTVKNSNNEDFTITDISTGGLTTYPCFMRTLVVDESAGTLTSTSTLLEKKLSDATLDIQEMSKDALEAQSATYGTIISAAISANMAQEAYELYDGTEVAQFDDNGMTSHDFPTLTYTRTFNNNSWQALFVPFAMQYADWSENFDVAVPDVAAANGLHFNTITSGSLAANTIALIRLKSGKATGRYSIAASPDNNVVTLQPANAESVIGTSYTLTGTYSGKTGAEMKENGGLYALSGGKLKTVGTNATDEESIYLKPMRWYLDITSLVRPESILVYIDDDTDATSIAISTSLQNRLQETSAYRMDGTPVKVSSSLSHGLYIINGKVTAK